MQNKPWCGICRLGSIGDNLIASSVLPLLARDYHVDMICQKPHHVVFENNPHISKLTALDDGHTPPGCGLEWQEWWANKAKEFDKFVQLSHTIEIGSALLPAQTQFRNWPASVRRKVYGHNYLEFTHDVAEVPHEFAPDFFPTTDESIKADATVRDVGQGKPVIGWVVSGSRLDKIYPPSPMVVARLIKETGAAVLIFGGGNKDLQIGKAIEDQVAGQNGSSDGLRAAISPADKPEQWNLRRSLATVQRCDLVIGPDTGLMWAVSMHVMPKIMLSSHASKENITKHWRNTVTLHADQERVPCWPCHLLHDRIETCLALSGAAADSKGAACISDINPTAIIEAAKASLAPTLTARNVSFLARPAA